MTNPKSPSKIVPGYKIGTVARLTGVTTHALRVWERRYHTVTPERLSGGGRVYSESDVHRLSLLKRLTDAGHAISQVAHLPAADMEKLLLPEVRRAPEGTLFRPDQVVSRFLETIAALDSVAAERMLYQAATLFPPMVVALEVVAPIFHEVGERWARGQFTIAQEHAASAVLRNHLGTLVRLFAPSEGKGPALATTLSGELHEFGALLACLVATIQGYRTVYLGPNLPADEIVHAARMCRATVVMVSLVHATNADDLASVRSGLPATVRMLVGGRGSSHIGSQSGVEIIPGLRDLEQMLART